MDSLRYIVVPHGPTRTFRLLDTVDGKVLRIFPTRSVPNKIAGAANRYHQRMGCPPPSWPWR